MPNRSIKRKMPKTLADLLLDENRPEDIPLTSKQWKFVQLYCDRDRDLGSVQIGKRVSPEAKQPKSVIYRMLSKQPVKDFIARFEAVEKALETEERLPIPRPDDMTEMQWQYCKLVLDDRQPRSSEEIGRILNPGTHRPREVAWRLSRNPVIKKYIAEYRQWEIQELGITKASIAKNLIGVINATNPTEGKSRRSDDA